MPSIIESADGPGNGTWFQPVWRIVDDLTLEGGERVQVRLNYTLGDGSPGSYVTDPFTIEDDDTATVSVIDVITVEEGHGEVEVDARLTVRDDPTAGPGLGNNGGDGPGASPQELLASITVDYASTDGTAIAGLDYRAVSGRLTFSGTNLSRAIPVQLVSDDDPEEDETFSVTVSNPVQDATGQSLLDTVVTMGNRATTITITDRVVVVENIPPSVRITTDGDPELGRWLEMTAHIDDPEEGAPTYQWQRRLSSGWRDVRATNETKRMRFNSPGSRTYRAIVVFSADGTQIVSPPLTLTW